MKLPHYYSASAADYNKFERALGSGALALLMFHMLRCPYRDILPQNILFRRAEMAFGMLLLLLAGGYVLYCAFFSPGQRVRIRCLLLEHCSFEQLFLVFLVFWYPFVCLFRQVRTGGSQFWDNHWWIFITVLTAFVMFPLAQALGKNRKRVIERMLKLVLIPHMLFYAWVLWQYLHMNFVTFPSGEKLEIIYYSMLIGCHRNLTGAYGLVMLSLSIYFIITAKHRRKLPYCFGAAVYAAVVIYSNCRTSWYTMLMLVSATLFLWNWFRAEKKSSLYRILSGLLLVSAAVALLYWVRIGLFALLDAALEQAGVFMEPEPLRRSVSAYGLAPLNAQLPAMPQAAPALLAGDPIRSESHSALGLSGRIELYRACLYVMFHDPAVFFFGVTPTDIPTAVYGICGVSQKEVSAHNIILQMGMSYGVPTMLAFIAFLASVAVRAVRVVRGQKKLPAGSWMIPVVVFCLMAQDVMEAYLNSGGTIVPVIFYIFCGWITVMDRDLKKILPSER